MQFPESTQGFNRYAYAGNNPLTNVDPSGFSFQKVLGIVGQILQFVPMTFWVGFFVNVAMGFLQGGVAGGVLAAATAIGVKYGYLPTGSKFGSRLALGATYSLVSNTLVGAANGYQTSLGQAFKNSLKKLPKQIATQALLLSAPKQAASVCLEAASAGTDSMPVEIAKEAPSSTATGAKADFSKESAETRSLEGIEISLDASLANMVDAIDLLANTTDLEHLRQMEATAQAAGANGVKKIRVAWGKAGTFPTGANGGTTAMDTSFPRAPFFGRRDTVLIRVNPEFDWAKATTGDIASILAHEFVHAAQVVQPSFPARTQRESYLYKYRSELQAYRYQSSIEDRLGVSEWLRSSTRVQITNMESDVFLCADESSCHMHR